MGKIFGRLFAVVRRLVALVVLAIVLSAVGYVIAHSGKAQSTATAPVATPPSPSKVGPAAGSAQSAPHPSAPVAPGSLAFEVTAPAGFRIDYSIGARHYAETVDATGHWKGKIDNIVPGYATAIVNVAPPKSPAAPYRASCDISYGGEPLSHNESDEERAAAPYVQCTSLINQH